MKVKLSRLFRMIALTLILTGVRGATGSEPTTNTVTLARHETVAEFQGTSNHRCMGLTSLCPDQPITKLDKTAEPPQATAK